MDSAGQSNLKLSSDQSLLDSQKPQTVSSGLAFGKDRESTQAVSLESVKEAGHEIEIPEKIEKVGIKKISETIELPPDVKKLGVRTTGASIPVSSTIALPQVTLPISDDKVLAEVNAPVTTSLRWLVTWCFKKLKRAHIALKKMHGKIVRVKI